MYICIYVLYVYGSRPEAVLGGPSRGRLPPCPSVRCVALAAMAAAPTGTDNLNGDSQRKKENCLGIDFNDKDKKTTRTRTSRTTTAEMAGAGSAAASHLEDICNSCLKPMLSCACKRTRRTNVVNGTTIDDTPMEDVEEVSTRSHTTPGNSIIPPPGLSTA